MRDFEYRRVNDAATASAVMREHPSAKLLAGGQSLLASMRMGLLEADLLVDLQGVAVMRSARALADGRLELGGMMTHAELAADPQVRQFAPGLAALAGNIADAQVRNLGTIGGSLANADPSACWAAGVLALGGEVETTRRTIPIDKFFTGLFSTMLEPDEVLVRVRLNRPRRFAYLKHEQAASRFAMVGVAVADFGGQVRAVANGTMQGAIRIPQFEHALERTFDASALIDVFVDEEMMPSDIHADADYRAHLAQVLCRRAVATINEGR